MRDTVRGYRQAVSAEGQTPCTAGSADQSARLWPSPPQHEPGLADTCSRHLPRLVGPGPGPSKSSGPLPRDQCEQQELLGSVWGAPRLRRTGAGPQGQALLQQHRECRFPGGDQNLARPKSPCALPTSHPCSALCGLGLQNDLGAQRERSAPQKARHTLARMYEGRGPEQKQVIGPSDPSPPEPAGKEK